MEKLAVMAAVPEDLGIVNQLYENMLKEWGASVDDKERLSYLELLTKQLDRKNVFIAKKDGVPVGVVSYIDAAFTKDLENNRIHLINAVVLRELRNKGIGAKLLTAVVRNADKKNIQRITTNCFKKNLAALTLLKKYGFKEYKETSPLNRFSSDIFLELRSVNFFRRDH